VRADKPDMVARYTEAAREGRSVFVGADSVAARLSAA
jgi:hypothetical protein